MFPDKQLFAEHLSGMVRCPTISCEDESKMDFKPFQDLQQYLEETYPLVHQKFQKEVIGPAALLYTWKCGRPNAKPPVLLAAHQDVVPPGDIDAWRHPPFAGIIEGGFVWGRGSQDCKSSIMGQMEAFEALIAEGFTPDFDCYLGYSYNEEVSTVCKTPGAKRLADTLKDRGVQLGLVLDEGGNIVPGRTVGVDGLVANVNIAEKGYADIRLHKIGADGHASAPGKGNLMVDLARAVLRINENPFPYHVVPEIATHYRFLAPHMKANQDICGNVEERLVDMIRLLEEQGDYFSLAKFRTTVAMTMCQASVRPNILPREGSVTLNCRPLPGDSISGIVKTLQKLVVEDGVQVELLGGRDPSQSSSIEDGVFQTLCRVIKGLHPQAKVIPGICLGGTDAYYYHALCKHVYRFSGALQDPRNGPAHGVNESISIETIDAIPTFVYKMLKNY